MKTKRTNVEIDRKKLAHVKRLSGLNTTKAAIDFALNRIVGTNKALAQWLALRGKIHFDASHDYKKAR